MSLTNKVTDYISENQVITIQEAKELGISRQMLSYMADKGDIYRVKPGVYSDDVIIDDYFLTLHGKTKAVYSHATALYFHGLSDRIPSVYDITVPQGYNVSHFKEQDKINFHYVKEELFELGIVEVETPFGLTVSAYDMERTICDIIKDANKVDRQIFSQGIKDYFKSKDKNTRKLLKYSRELGVEKEIRKYVEVLM